MAKRGKRLTREQKIYLSKHTTGLDVEQWLYAGETNEHIRLVHKDTEEIKIIEK